MFIVPIGRIPSDTLSPAIPFTTSLTVPSPPAATMVEYPSWASFLINAAVSPERESRKASASVKERIFFSRERAFSPRAAGLKIIASLTLSIRVEAYKSRSLGLFSKQIEALVGGLRNTETEQLIARSITSRPSRRWPRSPRQRWDE